MDQMRQKRLTWLRGGDTLDAARKWKKKVERKLCSSNVEPKGVRMEKRISHLIDLYDSHLISVSAVYLKFTIHIAPVRSLTNRLSTNYKTLNVRRTNEFDDAQAEPAKSYGSYSLATGQFGSRISLMHIFILHDPRALIPLYSSIWLQFLPCNL